MFKLCSFSLLIKLHCVLTELFFKVLDCLNEFAQGLKPRYEIIFNFPLDWLKVLHTFVMFAANMNETTHTLRTEP